MGRVKNSEIVLENDSFIKRAKSQIVGTSESLGVNYPEAIDKIDVGHEILLEDSFMKLKL